MRRENLPIDRCPGTAGVRFTGGTMILDFMRRLPSTMLPFFARTTLHTSDASPTTRGEAVEGRKVETQGRNGRVNETEKAGEKRDARRGSRCVSRRTGRIMLRFALIGEELEP